MSCRLFQVLIILQAVLALTSCSKKSDPAPNDANQTAENPVEQPIQVVIKKGDGRASEQAPGVNIPVTAPAAVVPPSSGPVAPILPVPPPPFPPIGGVIVPDECEDIFCGDGHKQDDEECDDGNDKNNDSCDNFCRKVRCGNGTVEGDEQCDDPDHISCTEDCTLVLCGNGKVDEGEECDPPNNENCTADCQDPECGNSIVEPGEECDDGNDAAFPCNANCELSCPSM